MNFITSNQKPITKLTQTLKNPVSKLLCLSLYSSSSSYTHSSSRRFEEESRSVRVSVWWDIEKCCFPSGINVFKIGQYISNGLRVNGIKGPIHISAFGERFVWDSWDMSLNGGKNSADQSLLVNLMHWVSQNAPPAHVFLISSDTDFAGILHKLRMNNYNILLASNDGVHTPGVLSSAASIMWHWNELAKGENFSGWHFNQPPDGPFNSWYGHYRGPLEDPFDVPDQQNSSKASNDSSYTEVISESPQPVPKPVLKQIRQIINSCPNGISSGEFRYLLARNKVTIDKNLYGYKTVSRFVQSMPHVIKALPGTDGRLYLHPVASVDSSASSKIEDRNRDVQNSEKTKDGLKEEKFKSKVEESPEKKASDVDRDDENNAIDSRVPDEVGLFRRLWRKWFTGSGEIEKTDLDIPDKTCTVSVSREKSLSEEVTTASTNDHEIKGSENAGVESDGNGKSEVSPGFVPKVLSWFKPGKNESPVNTTIEQSTEEPRSSEDLKHEVAPALVKLGDSPRSSKHELFSKETFWSAFGSFLRTYRASEIISSSKSRKQLARRLKNDGPLNLRSLQESDFIQLVDILISEKKYIKEFPTGSHRFQPNPPPEKNFTPVQAHNRNEFRSSSTPRNPGKKPSEKPQSEILADCQKLLDELLGQCPEGFNMGLFKKQFLEKYGYVLDHQKLGYPKLVSLLQLMSGIKIESARVFPDNVASDPRIESLGSKGRSSGSDHEHEPSVSDNDEFSDIEDQTRLRVKEDSSLLRILNSWHSPKDENDREKVRGSNPEELVDCSKKETGKSGKKPRTGKRDTFVSDSLESDKDKLIDGILGSLKKDANLT